MGLFSVVSDELHGPTMSYFNVIAKCPARMRVRRCDLCVLRMIKWICADGVVAKTDRKMAVLSHLKILTFQRLVKFAN